MYDAERLLAQFESGALIRPISEQPNVIDLVRALAEVCGVVGAAATVGARDLLHQVGRAERLVFVLIDGLGSAMLDRLPSDSFLVRNRVRDLMTVFPSTTAPVLTSIATGEWPAQHGVTTWFTYLPEIGTRITALPFVRTFDGRRLGSLGITGEQVYPIPALRRRFSRPSDTLVPVAIAGSIPSLILNGGSRPNPYQSVDEAFALCVDRVDREKGSLFMHIYLPQVDSAAHQYGMASKEVNDVIRQVTVGIERMCNAIGDRARVVVTSDHGHLNSPVEARHRVDPRDELGLMLATPPGADTRVLLCRPIPGKIHRFVDAFRERFGERFFVLSTDEVERMELFGPGDLSTLTRARIGEVVVISAGADSIEYAEKGRELVAKMASVHSGLSVDEMLVPLILI